MAVSREAMENGRAAAGAGAGAGGEDGADRWRGAGDDDLEVLSTGPTETMV